MQAAPICIQGRGEGFVLGSGFKLAVPYWHGVLPASNRFSVGLLLQEHQSNMLSSKVTQTSFCSYAGGHQRLNCQAISLKSSLPPLFQQHNMRL